MITRADLLVLDSDEMAYLYKCCDKEFEKNGYIYFDFDNIKIFKKQTIIDILNKYSDTLTNDKKDLPSRIILKLENIE